MEMGLEHKTFSSMSERWGDNFEFRYISWSWSCDVKDLGQDVIGYPTLSPWTCEIGRRARVAWCKQQGSGLGS